MKTQMAFKTPDGKKEVLKYYDSFLDKLTMHYEKLNVNTRYGNTFIISAGKEDKAPLILLHGSSMNSCMWIKDIEKFCANYKVYALDLLGEPGRSDERQLPFDTPDYALWLLDVLKALSIDKAILIGASLGAWLAIKFSICCAERVSQLVLLSPAGIGSQNHEFKAIAFSLLSRGEDGADKLFMKINGDNPVPEVMLNYQKLIATHFNSRQEPIPLFSDDELKSLTMPSILFVGGKDVMLNSDETVRRYSSLIPHTKIVTLPERGHSLAGLANEIIPLLEN